MLLVALCVTVLSRSRSGAASRAGAGDLAALHGFCVQRWVAAFPIGGCGGRCPPAGLAALQVLNLSATHSAMRCLRAALAASTACSLNLFGVTSLQFLSLHTNSIFDVRRVVPRVHHVLLAYHHL
jgi:hypothetical protein